MSDSERENGPTRWADYSVPGAVRSEAVRRLHSRIAREWGDAQRSACQVAAGRALWRHVIHDPVADVLAGETYLTSLHEKIKKDCDSNASEISGVILAVRTLWFDSKLEAALQSVHGEDNQVVLLGAGMDARAYRLSCLKESDVFEVDVPEVLQMKDTLLEAAMEYSEDQQQQNVRITAKSLTRVEADIKENDWLEKLERSGYAPEKNTVWILEGILYYLTHSQAMQVLKMISEKCSITQTFLLADFINKQSTTLSNNFHFYSDWPENLLPSLGFSHVGLSQIGDPDANFGLFHEPSNLFSRLRSLPRSEQTQPDGSLCCRLYLVQASGSPNQALEEQADLC